MTTAREAQEQADALLDAAKASPVRQIRYELEARAEEWQRAAVLLADSEGEGVIETLSAVSRGMRVFTGEDGWMRVNRTLNGGTTLHVEHPFDPRGRYWNLMGDTSPVVVRA